MHFLDELARGARRLRLATFLALILMLAIAAYSAVAAILGGNPDWAVRVTGEAEAAELHVLIVAAASSLIFAIGLWRLTRMLRHMEAGAFFTRETIAELRGFTLFVMLSALVAILLPPALALAGAAAASNGSRRLVLTFDGGDFFALLVSALLFFIARLFGEAQRLSEEASQIV